MLKKPLKRVSAVTKSSTRNPNQIVGELLSVFRSAAGLSQAQLGLRVRRDRFTIAKIESGVRRLDALELLVILDALHVEPGAFFRQLRKPIKAQSQ